ncbi:hypothetical protein Purlil1_12376 [Purpureocillium lilacinum]|uniref:Uncharacterized protein n=1 Tax=Purpureocillium lilacinum TaxID=33203 RepID=A0ABR0BH13_PURLI|nr:hypothetical protein Purlil1_12376 [Purpureocillium lilacinum]
MVQTNPTNESLSNWDGVLADAGPVPLCWQENDVAGSNGRASSVDGFDWDAFLRWEPPMMDCIDGGDTDETAAHTTSSSSGGLSESCTVMAGVAGSVATPAWCADIESRLFALEARLLGTAIRCERLKKVKARKGVTKRPRRSSARRLVGTRPVVHSVKLSHVCIGEIGEDESHEYTWRDSRRHDVGAWRSETIGAEPLREGEQFALMVELLSLKVQINGGSHDPRTLKWNAKDEVFEGQDMLAGTTLVIEYDDMFAMLCDPKATCKKWQVL